MEIIIALTFAAALYFTAVVTMKVLAALVTRSDYNGTINMIIACVLWGLFYYLNTLQ